MLAILLWTRATTQYSDLLKPADKSIVSKNPRSGSTGSTNESMADDNRKSFPSDKLVSLDTNTRPTQQESLSNQTISAENENSARNYNRRPTTPSDITEAIDVKSQMDRDEFVELQDDINLPVSTEDEDSEERASQENNTVTSLGQVSNASPSVSNIDKGTIPLNFSISDESLVPQIVWLMSFPNSVRTTPY